MRRHLALAALLTSAAAALLAPAQAASTAPTYTTVLLPGTTGSSEPRVTVAPKDVRYLTTNATNGDETVFRSADGLSWTKVTTPGNQSMPTSDVDVIALPSGRVITSELDFAGINFITHYSDDRGKTWTQSTGQTFADTDRQWFAAGPNNRVYLLFHNLGTGIPQHNMFVSTSTDGGASFGPPVPVSLPPQQDYLDLQCADSGGPSGIFVDQRTGRVHVVFGTRSSPAGGCTAQPVEVNVVAANRIWVVSADAAKTATPGAWTPSLAVDDTAAGKIVGMQLAGGAVDDAGNVYVAYPESVHDYPDYNGAAIKVVHSSGALTTWSTPFVVAPSGGAGNILPLVVAGSAGKLGLSYYAGDKSNNWYSMSAQVLDALSPTPHVTTAKLSPVVVEKGTASELMGACLAGPLATLNGFACGRSTDVNGIALDSCGRVTFTWPAQAGTPADGTYATQQVGGPRLRSSVCAQSVSKPVVVPPRTPPVVTPSLPVTPTGAPLAATGGTPAIAVIALLLLGTGLVVRRRRTL